MNLSLQSRRAVTDAERVRPSTIAMSPTIEPGPENCEDAFRALWRGHADFDQALIQPVAAVTGVARKKQDFIGRQFDRFCIGQQQIRQPLGQVRQQIGGMRCSNHRKPDPERIRRQVF